MNIDAYSACPCDPDKKIKFCCGKEIASDLNQIVTLSSGGQERAALDEIDRVIHKQGAKACLLTLKTRLLISRERIDEANQANELLLQNSPHNVTGHFHRCLIRLHRGDIAAAVNALQDAIDHVPSGEVPVSLATGFRMVGIGLLQAGHLIGGRAHLKFASLLKDHADRDLLAMVLQTYRLKNTPIFLQRNFEMPEVSDSLADREWAKKYHNARLAVSRGQFRKAYRYLKKIDTDYPGTATIKIGIAVLSLYLGCEPKEIAAAWKQVAELDDIPIQDAIEAEGLYRLISEHGIVEDQAFVTIECEVRDFHKLVEVCLSENRLLTVELEDDPVDPEPESQPPPRHRFAILDKPPVSAEEIQIDNAPLIRGNLNVYGKQTDREARIVVRTIAPDHLSFVTEFLKDRFGDLFLSEPESQEIEKVSPGLVSLYFNWHLPENITDKQYADIVKAGVKQFWADQWVHQPSALFDGMTPLAASQEAKSRKTLEWVLAEIENDPLLYHDQEGEIIAAIRAILNLPDLPKLTRDQVDLNALTCVQLSCLDYATFSDDDLIAVLEVLSQGQNPRVLRQICFELLKRPPHEKFNHAEIYSLLATSAFLSEEGIEYFAKARAICHEQNLPIGSVLMDELEFRLLRGRPEKVDELYNSIRLHHLQEPYVRQRLENLLSRLQMLNSSESDQASPARSKSIATPTQTTSKLERLGQASAESTSGGSSKLWIPE